MTNESQLRAVIRADRLEMLRQLLRDYEAAVEREAEGGHEWFWVDEIKARIKALDPMESS